MAKSYIPLINYNKPTASKMLKNATAFYSQLQQRRSIRDFSSEDVPLEVVDKCIQAASTAPSGANQQPWQFVVIKDSTLKKQIRIAAEAEEESFYAGRAGDTWIQALEPLGTNAKKPFLEKAPILIAIFEQKYCMDDKGVKVKHYYSKESTGIATGMLITALHLAGLVTLTHTPSPMNFLTQLLDRPRGERPFLLLVVGFPAKGAEVPKLNKKSLNEIRTII